MSVNLNTFKRNNKPVGRRSKLDGFTNEIMDLYHSQYSLDQILAFLELNNVVITKPSLSRFIKKSLGSGGSVMENIEQEINSNKAVNPQVEVKKNNAKFDWQNKIDPKDLF